MTADLRTRLEADRAALVEMLAATPDGRPLESGFVAMLADTSAALSAIDVMVTTDAAAANGRRVLVVDVAGTPAVLIQVYDNDGAMTQVPVLPGRALALAEQLLAGARQRLRQGDGR